MNINTGQNLSGGGEQGILIDISHPSLDTFVESEALPPEKSLGIYSKGGGPGGKGLLCGMCWGRGTTRS